MQKDLRNKQAELALIDDFLTSQETLEKVKDVTRDLRKLNVLQKELNAKYYSQQ